ncbi:hypothetical protein C8R46DRAFT_1035004 [Mycena filopes]|nr:hypothetical protein C8R46DRAFT_1035004 [Mycena filopes]
MFGPISDYYLVLEECKSLATASTALGGDIHRAERELSLPSLQALRLQIDTFANAIRFLVNIALDSLTSLQMETRNESDESTTFAGFLSSSESCLLLRACPAVVAASMDSFSLSDSALDQIANGTLLPKVQLLGLDEVDPAVLFRILKTRQESSGYSTILGATAFAERNCTDDEVDSFNDLLDAGVFASTYSCGAEITLVEKTAREQHAVGAGHYGINSLY